MSIERDICKAIDIISARAISTANHSSTVLATVVECINPLNGKYKVKYQTNELIAYNNNIFTFYNKDTTVYLYLKNGQLDEEIIILGPSHGAQLNNYTNIFSNFNEEKSLKENLQGWMELKKENKLQADICFMGHYVSKEELKNFKFYWYIKDGEQIKDSSPYGGDGWKCLNNKYNGMWIAGTSELETKSLTGTFKCVAAMDNFTFIQTINA